MSVSDILAALLFLLVPLRHSKADRRMAKDKTISPLKSKLYRFPAHLAREKRNYVSPQVKPLTV